MNLQFKVYTKDNFPLDYQAETIFQTKEWLSLYSMDKSYTALFCALDDNSNQTAVIQPILIHKLLPLGRFGTVAYAWGEPFFINSDIKDKDTILEQLLINVKTYCRKLAIMLEYRHWQGNESSIDVFKRNGFTVIPWFNVVNDYGKYDNNVDKMISPNRFRRMKSAIKKGVVINCNPNGEAWEKYYEMQQALYKKIHRPLPNKAVFDMCREKLSISRCITLEYNDKIIAGATLLILENREAYIWYVTTNKSIENNKNAGYLIHYAALKLAQEYNVQYFNFLGAGAQNKKYGVRDFKLKFGGDLIKEYRFRKLLL